VCCFIHLGTDYLFCCCCLGFGAVNGGWSSIRQECDDGDMILLLSAPEAVPTTVVVPMTICFASRYVFWEGWSLFSQFLSEINEEPARSP
jgi:hypothetical protein